MAEEGKPRREKDTFIFWTSDKEVAELIKNDLAKEIVRNDKQGEFGVYSKPFRGGWGLWVGRHDS